MFKDRIDAGRQLAQTLRHFKDKDVIVLAIPRGGLPLGAIVANELNASLDVALSKKIGHPYNKEYAIGAVSLENSILTKAMGVTKSYIEEETAIIRKKLKERYEKYHKNRPPLKLEKKTVIIIDDGMATGNTILVTVALIRLQNPKQIIVAVPVASSSAVQSCIESKDINEVICLTTPPNFRSVGQYYENFDQVTDEEAIELLENLSK